MKMVKRAISAVIAAAVLTPAVPCIASAEEEQNTKSISNEYMEFSVNDDTGFFSVSTLEGHPQKAADNDMDLLYDGSSIETSFTTVRIDGEDYIFGQDYGLFDIVSERAESSVDAVNNTITTVWTIRGITITQTAQLSRTENTIHTGNVYLRYDVENTSGEAHDIGIRVMLDNSLGEIDAPVTMAQSELAPLSKETEFISNGRDPGYSIRYLDSYEQPSREAYITLDDIEAVSHPDKLIVGHWYNLASTKWDYVPDSDFSFDTGFNGLSTADTATALYWDEETYQPGQRSGASVTYGVGEFTDDFGSSKFNISMELDGELVLENGAYNDDIVTATVNVYNNVDGSTDIENAQLTLSADDGVTFLGGLDGSDGVYELDRYVTELGFIPAGSVETYQINMRVDVQSELKALEVVSTLRGNNENDTVSVSKYIIAPGNTSSSAPFAVYEVYANKYHKEGQRVMTVNGKFSKELLDDKTKWKAALVNTEHDNIRYDIDEENATVVSDSEMVLTNNCDMVEGIYKLEFTFFDDYKELIGDIYLSDKTISIVDDPSLVSADFGIVAVLRTGSGHESEYSLRSFMSEAEFNSFSENLTANGYADMPIVLRGKFAPSRDEATQTITGYSATDDFTVNNVIVGEKNSSISYINGTVSGDTVEGDGVEIYGVGRATAGSAILSDCDWKIDLNDTQQQTLAEQNIKLEYTGINEYMFDVVGGLVNLKYGVLTRSAEYGDVVNFGGKFTLSGYRTPENQTPPDVNDTAGATVIQSPDYAKLSSKALYVSADITNCYVNKDGFVGIDTTFEVGVGKASNVTGFKVNQYMLRVNYDSINHAYGGAVTFSIGRTTITGALELEEVTLKNGESMLLPDDISATAIIAATNPIPVVPPFASITQLGFSLHDMLDLADIVIAETTDEVMKELGSSMLGVQGQIGVLILRVFNLVGTFDIGLNHASLSLVGSVPYIPGMSMTLNGSLGWSYAYTEDSVEVPYTFKISGGLQGNTFNILLSSATVNYSHTGGTSTSDGSDYFALELSGGIYLPPQVPFIGGMELLGATGIIDLFGISAVADLFGIEVGVSVSWDDGELIWLYDTESEPQISDEDIGLTNMVYVPVELMTDSDVSLFSEDSTFIRGKVNIEPGYRSLLAVGFNGTAPASGELSLTVDGSSYALTEATKENRFSDGNYYVLPDTGEGGRILIGMKDLPEGEHDIELTAQTSGIRLNSMDLRGFISSAKIESVTQNSDGTVTVKADKSLKDTQLSLYYTNSNDAYDDLITEEGVDEEGNKIINVYKLVDGERVEYSELMSDVIEQQIYSTTVTEDTNELTITPEPGMTVNSGDYYIMAKTVSPYRKIGHAYSDGTVSYVNENEPDAVAAAELTDSGSSTVTVSITEPEDANYDSYLVSLYNETDGEYILTEDAYRKGESIVLDAEPGKTYHAEIRTVNVIDDENVISSAQPYITNSVTVHTPQSVNVSVSLDNETKAGNYPDLVSGETVAVDYVNGAAASFTARTDEPVTGCFVYDGAEIQNVTEAATEFTYSGEFNDGMHTMAFKAVNAQGDATYSEPVSFAVNTKEPSIMLEDSFVRSENGNVTVKGRATNTEKLLFMDKEYALGPDGSFEITEAVENARTVEEYKLTAVGYSGNESSTRIFAVNSDFKPLDSLELLVNGEDTETVTLEPGETADLSVLGYTDGEQREFVSDAVSVRVVQGNNAVTIGADGKLKAQAPGTAYVKAVYDLGNIVKDDRTENFILEDMVEVSVMKKAPDVIPSIPNGASVSRGTKLTLSADGGDIYYTTDGSEPTTASEKYTDPISITKNVAIKARCYKEGYTEGDVITLTYIVRSSGGSSGGGSSVPSATASPAPTEAAEQKITASGSGGSVDHGYMAELTTDGEGKIYYTVDGSTPDKNSIEYTGPIEITEDTVIKAVVWNEGDIYSDVYTFEYTLNPYDIRLRDDVDRSQLLNGYPDGTFMPDNSITRAETAALLRRASEMYGYTVRDDVFTDVDMWAKDYINELAAADIVTGYPDGTFRPDDMVTRAEFVTMLMRIIGEEGGTSEFADVNGHWAEKYIDKASEYDYISGYPDGMFRPDGYITRAEATVIMMNVFGLGSDGTESRFSDVTPEHWAFGYIAD